MCVVDMVGRQVIAQLDGEAEDGAPALSPAQEALIRLVRRLLPLPLEPPSVREARVRGRSEKYRSSTTRQVGYLRTIGAHAIAAAHALRVLRWWCWGSAPARVLQVG